VQESAYQKPTIQKLLPLHNNYLAGVGSPEVVTAQETTEETAFLDAILVTPPMVKAQKLLGDKNLLRRSSPRQGNAGNTRAFRDAIHQAWFGLYSRANRTLGSSGFEHVFLGEVKDGKVSGFHNWVFFSKEEANTNLNYKGRIGQAVDLGTVKDYWNCSVSYYLIICY
jgi:poly(U)-specific endoribonuclease